MYLPREWRMDAGALPSRVEAAGLAMRPPSLRRAAPPCHHTEAPGRAAGGRVATSRGDPPPEGDRGRGRGFLQPGFWGGRPDFQGSSERSDLTAKLHGIGGDGNTGKTRNRI